MTKKELEEKNKSLREALDKAHADVQTLNEELKVLQDEKKVEGVLDELGIGGYYNKEERKWVVAELSFNRDTGEAKVDKQRKVGTDFAMFNYEINKFVAEQINLRSLK